MCRFKRFGAASCLLSIAYFVAALFCVQGCSPPNVKSTPGPEKVLTTYAIHLKNGNTKKALELLSGKIHPTPSESDIKKLLKDSGSSIDKLLEVILARQGVSIQWTMVLPDGRKVILVKEKKGWAIASGPILPASALSAEQALRDFLDAIQQGDCKAVTGFAPPKFSSRYSSGKIESACVRHLDSLKKTAAAIKLNLHNWVYLSENKAKLIYEKNKKVLLIKKRGKWFIQDM